MKAEDIDVTYYMNFIELVILHPMAYINRYRFAAAYLAELWYALSIKLMR